AVVIVVRMRGVFLHIRSVSQPVASRGMMAGVDYALSLKQPWAALLVSARKTIEVRRWPTFRRGRFLVHAALVSDPRREAWALVPDELRDLTDLTGGIIGACELTECKSYRTRAAFKADQPHHLNDPSWFQELGLYGFVCRSAEILP